VVQVRANSLKSQFREMLKGVIEADSYPSDGSIHAARKTLKRARASLRLMRAGMDDADYRRANHQLRDIARPLTQVRDAVALLDALESIRKARDKTSSRRYADEVHRALHDGHRLQRERLSAERLRASGEKLRAVDLEINRTPTKDSDAAIARRGIKRTFRCGREAFSKARKRDRMTLLHEWRKQVKYLANEIGLAEQLKLLKLKKTRRRAEHLADVLGDDHDLAILRVKLRQLSHGEIPERSAERKRLEYRIKEKRSKLQQKARRLGVRLYSAPVAKFNRSLKKQLKT
jgi:CHAD domain